MLFPPKLRVSRSLRKILRRKKFAITLDTAFRDVIENCARPRVNNPGGGTWITPEMLEAYCVMHERGYAHSVESWLEGELVGGLYGVALGNAFFGESMFSRETDASKVAFVHLVRQLAVWGYALIDCQMSTQHLFSLGAEEIRRRDFLTHLEQALAQPDRRNRWRLDENLVIL